MWILLEVHWDKQLLALILQVTSTSWRRGWCYELTWLKELLNSSNWKDVENMTVICNFCLFDVLIGGSFSCPVVQQITWEKDQHPVVRTRTNGRTYSGDSLPPCYCHESADQGAAGEEHDCFQSKERDFAAWNVDEPLLVYIYWCYYEKPLTSTE